MEHMYFVDSSDHWYHRTLVWKESPGVYDEEPSDRDAGEIIGKMSLLDMHDELNHFEQHVLDSSTSQNVLIISQKDTICSPLIGKLRRLSEREDKLWSFDVRKSSATENAIMALKRYIREGGRYRCRIVSVIFEDGFKNDTLNLKLNNAELIKQDIINTAFSDGIAGSIIDIYKFGNIFLAKKGEDLFYIDKAVDSVTVTVDINHSTSIVSLPLDSERYLLIDKIDEKIVWKYSNKHVIYD